LRDFNKAADRVSIQEAAGHRGNKQVDATIIVEVAKCRASAQVRLFPVRAENKEIVLKFPNTTFEFNGADYVGKFVLPNVYFHITTAYGILRNRGVALGKPDYLGG